MSGWQDLIDADPAVYHVILERPDGRWHSANIQANHGREAVARLRELTGLHDAPLVICDRGSRPIPVRVLAGEVVTPRGWEPKEATE